MQDDEDVEVRDHRPNPRKPPKRHRGPLLTPPTTVDRIIFKIHPDHMDRLQAYLARCAMRDLSKPAPIVTDFVRRAIAYYLVRCEEAEERLGLNKRAKPECVSALGVDGTRWCPEHGARWKDGDLPPESCRGSNGV